MQDSELLQEYVRNGTDRAFAELVRRYVDFVYSTALRSVSNSPLAEEIAQNVFLLLARKAKDLIDHPALVGWLYRTTIHLAAKAKRGENRRIARELEAAQMTMNDPDQPEADAILPLLDEALKGLQESDRLAVILRFFMKKPMREVGLVLGVSEAAAKMRITRALERLRVFFVKHGVACSVAGLIAVLGERSIQAAPVSLLPSIVRRLIQTATPPLAASWLSQTLFIMSQAKTAAIIIASAAVLILTVGVHHYLTQPINQRTDTTKDRQQLQSTRRAASKTPGKSSVMSESSQSKDITSALVERLRTALTAPLPKSGISWPSQEVIQSVADFGDKRAAFEALKSVVLNPPALSPEELGVGDPGIMVQGRAVSAMLALAKDVPEVVPFLWELYAKSENPLALDAFMNLKAIGLNPGDLKTVAGQLPRLSQVPAGRMFIPEAMASVISSDPAGSASAIPLLSSFLSNEDDDLRLSAACALVTSQLDKDPRVAAALAGPLTNYDSTATRMSVQALAQAGSNAVIFVPALLDLAKNTQNEIVRQDVLRAIAKIQPSTAADRPEIAQLLANDASSRDLGAKLDHNSATLAELTAALRLPQYTTIAAAQLASLGSGAANAVPALLNSLQGKNEDERDSIVDAILKIDPQTKIDRVDSKAISDAVIFAEISLGSRGNNFEDPLTNLIMQRRAFNTWWTRDEVVSFAAKLGSMDKDIQQTFIEKIIEKDPSMRSLLSQSAP